MLGEPGGGGASALNACGSCVGLSTIMPDLAAAVTAETIAALGDRRVSPDANAVKHHSPFSEQKHLQLKSLRSATILQQQPMLTRKAVDMTHSHVLLPGLQRQPQTVFRRGSRGPLPVPDGHELYAGYASHIVHVFSSRKH